MQRSLVQEKKFKNEAAPGARLPGGVTACLLSNQTLNERRIEWTVTVESRPYTIKYKGALLRTLDPRVLPPNRMKACGHIVVNEVRLEDYVR